MISALVSGEYHRETAGQLAAAIPRRPGFAPAVEHGSRQDEILREANRHRQWAAAAASTAEDMPGFARIKQECEADYGAFTGATVRQLRSKLCRDRAMESAAIEIMATVDVAAMLLTKKPTNGKPRKKGAGRPTTKDRRAAWKNEFDEGVKVGKWKTAAEFARASPKRKPDGTRYSKRTIEIAVYSATQTKPKKRKQIARAN
jgi:hypothetical protein